MYEEFPVTILNKEYKVMGEIDNGAEGSKKIVQRLDNNESKYLVKILPCSNIKDLERYEREINIFYKLNHPNIAKLISHTKDDDQLMMFFYYYSGGSLANMIDNERLDENRAKGYFKQLIEAVDFCHINKIAHRDIKPDNIILDTDLKTAVLTDFGLCKELDYGLFDDFPGTPLYNSPEKFMGQKYCGVSNDIWCLGITLYEMLTGDTPFYPHKTGSIEEMARNIVYMDVRFPTYITEDAKSLINALLQKNPSKRCPIGEVRKHPWLKDNPTSIEDSLCYINAQDRSDGTLDGSEPSSNLGDSLSKEDDHLIENVVEKLTNKSSQQNFSL
eukprot:TRINITY_DN4206_c0_g1_i1.p1 TRINITY_DN4206_c0_g1~~TRINITY_DN4206_c0_g1_i1.p1  ORF type:complete len:330 (-),score=77.54 TRINITY_DN4206_c0_g1_i1:58-1047(-)